MWEALWRNGNIRSMGLPQSKLTLDPLGKNDSLRLANNNSKHDVKSDISREVVSDHYCKSHGANSAKDQAQHLRNSSRATTSMGIVFKLVHSK